MAKRKLERTREVGRIQKIVQDEFPDVDERITSQFSKRVLQKHWPDKKSSEYIKAAFEQKDERYYGDQHASDCEYERQDEEQLLEETPEDETREQQAECVGA